MKIGTRLTSITTALALAALGVFGYVTVRTRGAELRHDLETQTRSVGNALRIAHEAALQEGLFEDVRKLVRRFQASEPTLHITYLELRPPPPPQPSSPVPSLAPPLDAGDAGSPATATDGGAGDGGANRGGPGDGGAGDGGRGAAPEVVDDQVAIGEEDDEETRYVPPPPDPARDARLRLVLIDGEAHGEHLERDGAPAYAYTLPLHDDQGRVVAAIDVIRDGSHAASALAATVRNVLLTVVLLGAALAVLVGLTTRSSLTRPLERLVVGIGEVSHGDMTGAILRGSEDELGELAERFNQMTASLREARVETERSVEARLSLETRLRHSEKLATIGQLAAQIAHEVGTPLGVIGGRARTLEKKAADPAEVAKNAGIIAAQADRITKIIQRLLDVARKRVTVREPVDLTAVVRDTLEFLEQKLAASSVVARVHPFQQDQGEGVPGAPTVLADADELQQVFLNLFLNAIQAMPDGGVLELSTRGELRRKPGLDMAEPGRYVVLEILDHGSGISADDRERIFEPFYSTRHQDGGTGLGLSVSLGIVRDHDGWIDVDSAPGVGTVFRVFLPAPDAAA